MKLLEAIECIEWNDEVLLNKIKECIHERLIWLEIREPETDYAYEKWEEKYEQLNFIYDIINDYIEDLKNDNEEQEYLEENLNDIYNEIIDYQDEFGGLSRLKIEE